MKRTKAMIGLASLIGAAMVAGPAMAVTAYSPTGHLNVRSGPGFQYPAVAQMQANAPAPVTGCIADYSWCSVALGGLAAGRPARISSPMPAASSPIFKCPALSSASRSWCLRLSVPSLPRRRSA